jgi:electron transport complex protein RnfG
MRDIAKTTVPLFIICICTGLCLAFVNHVTKGPIEARAKQDIEEKKKAVLPAAQSFEKIAKTELADGSGLIIEASKGTDGGKTAGYVFIAEPKGYGGAMIVTIGIDAAGKITGVKLGDNKETPGLGTKAGEEPFITQFSGKTVSEQITLVKKPPSGNQIQAISGATISSRAITAAVQAAAVCAKNLIEKEAP